MSDFKLLDGKLQAKQIRENLIRDMQQKLGLDYATNEHILVPHLVVILVGDNSASEVYIRQKKMEARLVGMKFTCLHLPKVVTNEQVLSEIQQLNEDPGVHGLIVQLPLPKQLDKDLIVEAIDPTKDVDGFHPLNIGRMCLNNSWVYPATPYGIRLMLQHYQIETVGKHIVIIGKSLIVGQPLMNLLSLENGARGTVTCCDKYTENLGQYIQSADILVVATGFHHLVQDPLLIKKGAVVIDVGMHRIPDASQLRGYRLEGDVDFEKIKYRCRYITPVPGGVGPMTVSALLLNTWRAFLLQSEAGGNLKFPPSLRERDSISG